MLAKQNKAEHSIDVTADPFEISIKRFASIIIQLGVFVCECERYAYYASTFFIKKSLLFNTFDLKIPLDVNSHKLAAHNSIDILTSQTTTKTQQQILPWFCFYSTKILIVASRSNFASFQERYRRLTSVSTPIVSQLQTSQRLPDLLNYEIVLDNVQNADESLNEWIECSFYHQCYQRKPSRLNALTGMLQGIMRR